MTVREVLRWGHERLLLSSDSARLDAELLLAHAMRRPVTFLLAHDDSPVGFLVLWRYRSFIEQRRGHMPVAYLTGRREFFGLDFEVNRHVLVPRPDTEILAEAAVDHLRTLMQGPMPPLLLDVGTGSGCIAVSLLKTLPGLQAVATDVSRAALRVARRNARRHGVGSRIRWFRSDLLQAVPSAVLNGQNVVVTANLPYIPPDFSVNPELRFEPQGALYGGRQGTALYEELLQQLLPFRPQALFLELFEFQIALLALKMPGYAVKTVHPMRGEARLLVLECL